MLNLRLKPWPLLREAPASALLVQPETNAPVPLQSCQQLVVRACTQPLGPPAAQHAMMATSASSLPRQIRICTLAQLATVASAIQESPMSLSTLTQHTRAHQVTIVTMEPLHPLLAPLVSTSQPMELPVLLHVSLYPRAIILMSMELQTSIQTSVCKDIGVQRTLRIQRQRSVLMASSDRPLEQRRKASAVHAHQASSVLSRPWSHTFAHWDTTVPRILRSPSHAQLEPLPQVWVLLELRSASAAMEDATANSTVWKMWKPSVIKVTIVLINR
jgi:hypothetical protein